MPRLFALLAAMLFSALIVSSAWSAIGNLSVRFELDGEEGRATIQANFRPNDDHNWQASFAASDLSGLDLADFHAPGSRPLAFNLVREAGRLDCTGQGGASRAHGSCRFAPDAAFAQFLDDRGVGRPSEKEAFVLMAVNARRELADALLAARYPMPDADQYAALSAVGVSGSYIAGLAQAGYRPDTTDTLLQFKALDISPEFIEGFARNGYGKLRPEELVQFRVLGVDHEFIAGFEKIGYGRMPAHELVQLKALGITPDYVASFERIGYKKLRVGDLVQMKAMGITPDFVRSVQRDRSALPSTDELVRRRALGYWQRPRD